MHAASPRSRRDLHFEKSPGHHGQGRSRVARESSEVTDAIEEDGMAVEEEQGTEQAVEATAAEPEQADVEDDDDDVVDAHVWRAQS